MYHSAPALLTSERSDEFGIDSRGQLSPIVFSVAIFSRFCITELLEVHLRYSVSLKRIQVITETETPRNASLTLAEGNGGAATNESEKTRHVRFCFPPPLLYVRPVNRVYSKIHCQFIGGDYSHKGQ